MGSRHWKPLLMSMVVLGSASTFAEAQVVKGPFPDTATSEGGTLIWYTGELPLAGRTWGELDEICGSVPIHLGGWRAPTEVEVQTLFTKIWKKNAVTEWSELHMRNPPVMVPAIPPFDRKARLHPQVNILLRELYTYEGQRIELSDVAKRKAGKMYIIRWFNRWTVPELTIQQSITHTPASYKLGKNERLLCVTSLAR